MVQEKLWRFYKSSIAFLFAALTAASLLLLHVAAAPEDMPIQTPTQETHVAAFDTEVPTIEQAQIYGIGSVSKMFSAVTVMRLAQEGKIDLDMPLTTYLPEFEMADIRYQQITPRMLLDHSAGLMGTSDRNARLLGDLDTTHHDTLLQQLKTQQLKAEPGAFSVYSNDSFTLAELLTERVSGLSFSEYLRQTIFMPLGMKNSFTPNDSFDRTRQAPAYVSGSGMQLPPEAINLIGAGGILSTAEDLCRFGQIFTKAGTGVLSSDTVNEMATAQTNNPLFAQEGSGQWIYGLGWDSVEVALFQQNGIKAVTKGGDIKVYHGNLTVIPDHNMSAAVLSSGGDSAKCQVLANELLAQALQQTGQRLNPLSEPLSSVSADASMAVPSQLEGYYVSSGLIKVRFSSQGTLFLSTLDQRRNVTQEYLPTSDGRYCSTNGDYINSAGELVSAEGGTSGKTILSFQNGTNGETYLSIAGNQIQPGLGQTPYALPFAQKVQIPTLSEAVTASWATRNGKKYYLVSEKSTSSDYLDPATTIRLPVEGGGYLRNSRIVDQNTARPFLELPIILGRDLLNYHFYQENHIEYLDLRNGEDSASDFALKRRYICEDGISALPEQSFQITLSTKDTAHWFSIPETLSGQNISILLPDDASFFVYDANDRLTNSSIAQNASNTVCLPKGGKIVLVGSVNAFFQIEY